jgi:hypothetical protein
MILNNIQNNNNDGPSNVTFFHAPMTYFAIDQLKSHGPRQSADIGTPYDASRELSQLDVETTTTIGNNDDVVDDDRRNTLSFGSW